MREFFRTFYMSVCSTMFIMMFVITLHLAERLIGQDLKIEEQNIKIEKLSQKIDTNIDYGTSEIQDFNNRFDTEATMDDMKIPCKKLYWMEKTK